MKIEVRTADMSEGPEKYISKDKADAVKSGYHDYDAIFIFEDKDLEEVMSTINYDRFIVNFDTGDEDIDVAITVYDYYVE